MQMKWMIGLLSACIWIWMPTMLNAQGSGGDPREDGSPWGFASGAEWSNDYPQFNPLMHDAGARWIRYFPEWKSIQPQQGTWNWTSTDAFVANCNQNNLHVAGVFAYFAPWASADGGTRQGPIKDMQYFRDYVATVAQRYQQDIMYWEVWNEFNGSFYQGIDKVQEYADLVVAAYDTAKAIDPNIKIGMSVANFDISFLDRVIKAGAAGHFDYIAVHPYENTSFIANDGEPGYLSLVPSLRSMLAANNQSQTIGLWITEFGYSVSVAPDAQSDDKQADILTKAYVMSLAQGFDRMCWFEARGPAYGSGTDHGLIRPDWSLRPSYHAMHTMTGLLGATPSYLGWLNLGQTNGGGFGFVFQGASEPVLVAWAPLDTPISTTFSSDVQITDQTGLATNLNQGMPLNLNNAAIFVSGLPQALVQEAQDNAGDPFPWGGDYANATEVDCQLGVTNIDNGLTQRKEQTTLAVNMPDHSFRQLDFDYGSEGRYAYFRADPQFAPFGTTNLKVTIKARRITPQQNAGMNLFYESQTGYRNSSQGWWTIPADDQWHERTWTLNDANFVGQWGWNFRFSAVGSPNAFQIMQVKVTKY
ncbi:MAG: endo-1,4-beta-xylanase [Phycisphaeraceae bacterium JB051]